MANSRVNFDKVFIEGQKPQIDDVVFVIDYRGDSHKGVIVEIISVVPVNASSNGTPVCDLNCGINEICGVVEFVDDIENRDDPKFVVWES